MSYESAPNQQHCAQTARECHLFEQGRTINGRCSARLSKENGGRHRRKFKKKVTKNISASGSGVMEENKRKGWVEESCREQVPIRVLNEGGLGIIAKHNGSHEQTWKSREGSWVWPSLRCQISLGGPNIPVLCQVYDGTEIHICPDEWRPISRWLEGTEADPQRWICPQ